MLTRLQKIQTALIDSRSTYAGGSAGFLFMAGRLFQIPLKHFLFGFGPAITTFVISSIAFIGKAIKLLNFSPTETPNVELNKAIALASTTLIINKFNEDPAKTNKFLMDLGIKENDMRRLQEWRSDSDDDLQDVFDKIYKEIQPSLEKYSVSTLFALMNFASHFMEVMLIQAYYDADTFLFNEVTPQNVTLCAIGTVGLVNAITEFFSQLEYYNHPNHLILCDRIFKYHQQTALPDSDSNSLPQNNTSAELQEVKTETEDVKDMVEQQNVDSSPKLGRK